MGHALCAVQLYKRPIIQAVKSVGLHQAPAFTNMASATEFRNRDTFNVKFRSVSNHKLLDLQMCSFMLPMSWTKITLALKNRYVSGEKKAEERIR